MASHNVGLATLKQKAARYCAYQERAPQEVLQKLRQLGASAIHCATVMAELEAEGYMNAQRFACAYVRGKFSMNRWGRVKIAMGLRQKHISEEHIEIAMQEIDAEAYEGILKKLARQKYTTLQDDDALVRKQKLLRYLAGKGYEAHLCHQMADYVLLNH